MPSKLAAHCLEQRLLGKGEQEPLTEKRTDGNSDCPHKKTWHEIGWRSVRHFCSSTFASACWKIPLYL